MRSVAKMSDPLNLFYIQKKSEPMMGVFHQSGNLSLFNIKEHFHSMPIFLLSLIGLMFFSVYANSNSPDQQVRLAAVQKLNDQTVLAKIAMEDTDDSVRITAVDKLTDQAILEKIALESNDYLVRRSAVDKLIDQTILAKIALEDTWGSVRLSAVEKLTDQTVLAKIALKDTDDSVRQATIEKIADQTILAKIALESTDFLVRCSAIHKLNDLTVLAKIAIEDTDDSVRIVAIKKLAGDQSILAKIAIEDSSPGVCYTAVANISDISLLTDLKKKSKDELDKNFTFAAGYKGDWAGIHVYEIAILKLFLANPLVEAKLGKTRVNVKWESLHEYYTAPNNSAQRGSGNLRGEKVTISVSGDNMAELVEQAWSTDFPRTTGSLFTFLHAEIDIYNLIAELMQDLPQTVLAKIALEDTDDSVRYRAIEKITDQTILVKFALESTDFLVRRSAVDKLTDQTILVKIAMEDTEKLVRQAAIEKITDQTIRAKIALRDTHHYARLSAIEKLVGALILMLLLAILLSFKRKIVTR
jgi:hypothetical protein